MIMIMEEKRLHQRSVFHQSQTDSEQSSSPHVNTVLYEAEFSQTVVAAVPLRIDSDSWHTGAKATGNLSWEQTAPVKELTPPALLNQELPPSGAPLDPSAPCLNISYHCIQWHLQPLQSGLGCNNYRSLLSDVTGWVASKTSPSCRFDNLMEPNCIVVGEKGTR